MKKWSNKEVRTQTCLAASERRLKYGTMRHHLRCVSGRYAMNHSPGFQCYFTSSFAFLAVVKNLFGISTNFLGFSRKLLLYQHSILPETLVDSIFTCLPPTTFAVFEQ